MKIVFYGLTITSSWGNGHATTYRSLCKALARRGHLVHFVEKDVEWYRSNRDLPDPIFCTVHLYEDWGQSRSALLKIAVDADVVVVGSYFPDAISLTRDLVETHRCPVLFYDIDTPITLAKLRSEGRTEYLEARHIPIYAAYLSFTGGPALRELEQRFGSPRALPLFCSVDPELYHPSPPRPDFRCDLSYLGTYAPDRQPKLSALLDQTAASLEQMNFIVAGPQYPPELTWQRNVTQIVHISPPDHPAFYSSSRFTLNLTRDSMVAAGYSPSVRLFEASACAAAIISDSWPGLDEFLAAGTEILLASETADVVTILRDISDEEAKRIGTRARDRILSEHTAQHRAVQFEQIVSDCSSPSR